MLYPVLESSLATLKILSILILILVDSGLPVLRMLPFALGFCLPVEFIVNKPTEMKCVHAPGDADPSGQRQRARRSTFRYQAL